ncbi:hypothetical protein HYC85_030991 [Camellia sinensis]|uniref:Reverse transcriptase zinc-binding domain-containing protein n=1 Tax=Camellia sinensis TaxID=4442 RepID=A0A7J7FR59_CAMSI|nr:hypothetical protein HYC85_030991 [Camellia sinensis]
MEKHKATRLLGEASSSGNIQHVWKSIWGLPIKRKIQHFMWRCAHNILPTNLALCQRKVLTDPWCPRCGVELETLDHLLLRYLDSQLVWKCSPLRLEWPLHITLDCFSKWWQYLEHLLADKTIHLVCYIC